MTASSSFQVERGAGVIVVTLPIRTVSEPNVRDHWSRKGARTKGHRSLVGLVLRPQLQGVWLPARVLLTRRSPGKLDLKAVRDGVADAFGLADDSDPRIAWLYAQERVALGRHGVTIAIARGM